MRATLVTFLFGVTVLVSLRDNASAVVSSYTYLYYLIGYSYSLTALSAFMIKYIQRPVLLSYAQILGDIFFITGILHITGGMESPFVFLYFFSIMCGSILRYQQGSLIAALLSTFSYLSLIFWHASGPLLLGAETLSAYTPTELYYRTFLNLFSFVIIAFLSSQLAGRLKVAGEEIREKADSIENLQALHENIVQSVTSGLITTDLNGRITSVNLSAEKILRTPKHEILKARLNTIFPYPEVREYLELNRINKEDKKFTRIERNYSSRQDKPIMLGMTLTRLRNKRGILTGCLCTFQDLTQIKALEERMRRNEQLAVIGELAAGMAHEIRNPLAAMSGSIQVLQSELNLNHDNSRLMEIILKETDRLNNLIGNFLTYAKPGPLVPKAENLKELMDETFILLKNSDRVNQTIEIVANVEENIEILADAMAIRQVFWNLATNSIEAMPDGGTLEIDTEPIKEPVASLEGFEKQVMVRVTFSDTGKGISPEIKKKIFFPFHTNKAGGSGLGLAIVHQIVKQHGGWIDFVSTPEKGTSFHLYLPKTAEVPIHQEV
jgi:two-component system sensor histidine kinase PilS (NtrC family)